MKAGVRELFWPLLGNWAGSEEQAASPGAAVSSARAMIIFKLDVADSVVVQDYRQVRADGGEFSAHGVFMMTPGTSEVRWWLFDSDAQLPEVAYGQWRGPELIMIKHSARGRAEHRFTVVDDQLDYQIQLGDTEPTTLLTGHYRRISGH